MSRKPMCQIALVWGALSHENVLPLLGICEAMDGREGMNLFFVIPYMECGTFRQWRQNVNPSRVEIVESNGVLRRCVQTTVLCNYLTEY
jgi:hypothetical protein